MALLSFSTLSNFLSLLHIRHCSVSAPQHPRKRCRKSYHSDCFVWSHLTNSIKKAYDTAYSQAVTHPSTNAAQSCLTSVIGRELVFSTWYGRRHIQEFSCFEYFSLRFGYVRLGFVHVSLPVALLSFDFRSSGWHCSVSYLRIVSYTQASRWHCSVSYLRISQCICSFAHMHTSTWSQCNCSICVGLHAVHGTCVQG